MTLNISWDKSKNKDLLKGKRRRKKKMARKTKKAGLAKRRAARKAYQKAKKKPLGEGSRFKAVARAAKASGAKNPEAVAAAQRWKKYGKKGGAKLISFSSIGYTR